VIGLMVPEADADDGVLMTFVATIARESRRFGYDILLVTAQEGADGIRRVVSTGVCEGLILMELDRFDERVAPVIESGLPFVTIGKPEEFPQGSVIDLDFEMLGHMVVECALEEQCDRLLLFGAPGRKRARNDVARFLAGVEQAAEEAALEVILDAGALAEVPERALRLTLPNQRTALFGITGVRQVLFAMAATGALVDDTRLLIALSGQDLVDISPLLAAVPQLDPRRVEISELAVQELVRLLRTEEATPRITLVEPRWLEG
jgi:DNA-binding LacI/PurR family transcriptional regulator